MIQFDGLKFNNAAPVYMQIASYFKRQILLGNFCNGDALPSRRELAALLDINPNTAQKAFKLMEEEGFIITKPNLGSILHINEAILNQITLELTEDMVKHFISDAKSICLSQDQLIELIKKFWNT